MIRGHVGSIAGLRLWHPAISLRLNAAHTPFRIPLTSAPSPLRHTAARNPPPQISRLSLCSCASRLTDGALSAPKRKLKVGLWPGTRVLKHIRRLEAQNATFLVSRGWTRGLRTSSVQLDSTNRDRATADSESPSPSPRAELSPKAEETGQKHKKAGPESHEEANTSLLEKLPDLSHRFHRPSKEELLAAATGFWSRLKIRFKWFSIRSARPFNADEISALFSWIVLGHVLWIIVGTTTFFSLAILTVNTVFAQETLARWIGNYLTKSSGVKVVFESAIVPNWRNGVISFKNVFVSRRPGQGKSNVSKGSPTTAAAAAAANPMGESANGEEEDTNYTQFDVSIDTINVTLSFAKWFNGKGLLRDVEISGVRGAIDRTSVYWDPSRPVDPRSLRHEHHTGDFELDHFKMDDVLISVYQPKNFRPFSVSIFSCDLPRLRKQWLFYDILSANMMSGSFDDSLFTIHPRQTHNYTGHQLSEGIDPSLGQPNRWKKHSRIRIDGVKIDHLNRGVEGPFGWIHEGNVDIVADVMIPTDNDESIAKVMSDFYDRMEGVVTSNPYLRLHNRSNHHTDHLENSESSHSATPSTESPHTSSAQGHYRAEDPRLLVMDLRIHLNDVRAAVPLFTRDISYVNNALIRPIVAYINQKKAFIPVNCRVVKRVTDFDGSWTIFDSGLMNDLSREVSDTLGFLHLGYAKALVYIWAAFRFSRHSKHHG